VLVSYLNSGRPVYFEGGDFGFNNKDNELWPYTGTSYLGDGQALGNVQTLVGQSGTFAQNLGTTYAYNEGPDAYVDEFDAAGGTVCLRDQSSIGRVVSFDAGTYRTVTSSVIFGAQRGPDRGRLMQACAAFLVYGLGLAGKELPGVGPALLVAPNPVRGGLVRFSSAGRYDRVTVVGMDGRSVAELDLRAGAGNLDCAQIPTGAYVARATGPSGAVSRTFIVAR